MTRQKFIVGAIVIEDGRLFAYMGTVMQNNGNKSWLEYQLIDMITGLFYFRKHLRNFRCLT